MRSRRLDLLHIPVVRESYRDVLIAYLKAKVQAEDWHGVSDAANDLRELDARAQR